MMSFSGSPIIGEPEDIFLSLIAVFTGRVILIVIARERSERGNRMMLKGMTFCLLTLSVSLMLVAIAALALAMTGLGWVDLLFSLAGVC